MRDSVSILRPWAERDTSSPLAFQKRVFVVTLASWGASTKTCTSTVCPSGAKP